MESTAKCVIRFAAFEVDLPNGLLLKHGHRIKLQEQPFRILQALLERPGEIVTRDELRERVWGKDTFVDFDHGLNAAVNRLRDALSDSAEKPRYIETVARRGYRFIAPIETVETGVAPVVEETAAEAAPVGTSNTPYRWRLDLIGIASLVAVCLVGLGIWMERGNRRVAPERLVQETALAGSETMPAFSPDGKQLVYVWNGEKEEDANIYVKMVGSENALRLTSHPGADLLPSWSPDGREIAFARVAGKTEIYVVSPLGGPERKLFEFPGLDDRMQGPETKIVGDLLYPIVSRPSWSADGKYLAVTRYGAHPEPGDGAVLLVPVDGGPSRTLLKAEKGDWYKHPTFSPDGRELAVVHCKAEFKCQIEVVPLSTGLAVEGPARPILASKGQLRGLDWAPDGESLIVAGFSLPHFYCWRVWTRKEAEPERIEMAGSDAIWPSVSRAGGRLAYSRSILQADIFRLERGHLPAAFASSTTRDISPKFSPDGSRLAFESSRSGGMNIWVAQSDGTGLRQVSKNVGDQNHAPSWSPDGRHVGFASTRQEGGGDVWVVDVDNGQQRRLTQSPGSHTDPSWSRDGKHIYYTSNRSGRLEIWRMNTDGGEPTQITQSGGVVSTVSTDGKTLYFVKGTDTGAQLFAKSLEGGGERLLVSDQIVRYSYTVVAEGIYYITPSDESHCEIRFHEFATGRKRVVETIERPVAFGLSVSPDQKTFLYSRPITGADLMVIENFL